MDDKTRIETLREELHRHNYLYYVKSQPEITDQAFDAMLRELSELEAKHPEWYDPTVPQISDAVFGKHLQPCRC